MWNGPAYTDARANSTTTKASSCGIPTETGVTIASTTTASHCFALVCKCGRVDYIIVRSLVEAHNHGQVGILRTPWIEIDNLFK